MGEVSGLGAVAEDCWGLVVEVTIKERGDDSGVRGVRGLSWAEDVEVAEARGVDAVAGGPASAEGFTGEFGRGVRGFGFWSLGFDLWERGVVAVGRGRCGVDDACGAGFLSGGQDAHGPGRVDDPCACGILDRFWDRSERGEVEDILCAFDCGAEGDGIEDGALDEADLFWVGVDD